MKPDFILSLETNLPGKLIYPSQGKGPQIGVTIRPYSFTGSVDVENSCQEESICEIGATYHIRTTQVSTVADPKD